MFLRTGQASMMASVTFLQAQKSQAECVCFQRNSQPPPRAQLCSAAHLKLRAQKSQAERVLRQCSSQPTPNTRLRSEAHLDLLHTFLRNNRGAYRGTWGALHMKGGRGMNQMMGWGLQAYT